MGREKQMTRAAFQPRLDVLAKPQRLLWQELAATPRRFVLYGGTAIALRLGHRQSADFDFFSTDPFVPSDLIEKIPYLRAATMQQSSENTLTCMVDRGGSVQVAFFGGVKLNRVEDPEVPAGGPPVASLLDLAATKVKVLLDRASAKDYLDLDALLSAGIALPKALAAARAVYGETYNPALSLKALTFFDEGDLHTLRPELRQRLTRAARAVDYTKLPFLEFRRGLLATDDQR